MTTLEQELVKTATLVAKAVVSVHAAIEREAARQGTTLEKIVEVAEHPIEDRELKVRAMERRHERAVTAIKSKWKRY